MSTQLEFIMQLYMMNLLQQQQQMQQNQQQQQQQQQSQQFAPSPVKAKDSLESAAAAMTNLRTQKRKLSQNTNTSSSSRSCSPNSNLSIQQPQQQQHLTPSFPISTATPQISLLQQQQQLLLQQQQQQQQTQAAMNPMLLNNLPALTQLMLLQQQQHQQQQQITSSNLLLTPTTPNSSSHTSSCTPSSSSPMAANYLANSFGVYAGASVSSAAGFSTSAATPPPPSHPHQPSSASLFFPSSAFPAQNSSSSFIATSSSSPSHNFLQSSTVTSTPNAAVGSTNVALEVHNVDDTEEDNGEEMDVKFIKTEQLTNEVMHLTASAHSTSGLRPLELTSDSMEDSKQMPFTPEKSEYSLKPLADHDPSNVTPVTLKNAILTPPSSEQLSSKQHGSSAFEGSSSSVGMNKSSSTASNSSATSATNSTTNLTGSTCVSVTGVDSFLTEENLKHLRKNSSYLECENPLCRQENLREHFHCYEEPCQGKILSKKDDIIRHLKWHKKRKESLLLGFARFSSSDDCAPEYGAGCAYNWKQTHYHCIYEDCPKVYVSTSDVQMHANFHRKNSEIVQEGFRRFRAHENCKIEECPFYGKKTSHYHCCREGCNHTFKNKADMEKHKVYHMKDHQLTQDGFKKILKTEKCPFDDCKYSCVSNHIHCVRENCNYILHSSTQMISHKRKHDRAEGEQNYQQFKGQRDSSEEESPNSVGAMPPAAVTANKNLSVNTSTPLSSLSAEHFLARKRGRPPKKIQLPSEASEAKRLKLESPADSNSNSSISNANVPAASTTNPLAPTMPLMNPFMANFNPANVDPNAPNFQLTHLMALFQLQNPLFYQNLYPRGLTAANMANLLGSGNLPAAAAPNTPTTNVKQEFNEKPEFKE